MKILLKAGRIVRRAVVDHYFSFSNGLMLAVILGVGVLAGWFLWRTTFGVPREVTRAFADPSAAWLSNLDPLIFGLYAIFALVGFALTIYKLAALSREHGALAHWREGRAFASEEKTIVNEVKTRLSEERSDDSLEAVLAIANQRLSDLAIGKFDLTWLQTTAIRLGILGTFVGLVSQLVEIRRILAGAPAQPAENGAEPVAPSRVEAAGEAVAALALAFNSSISGLLAALLLALMAVVVGARTREVRQALAKYVWSLGGRDERSAATAAVDPAAAEAIRAASAELREGGNQLAAAARELREQIRAETESLRALAAEQAKALTSAAQLAKQVETAETRLLGAFEASLARTAAAQGNALAGVEQRMAAIATILERHENNAHRALQNAAAEMAAQLDGKLAPSLDRIAEALANHQTPGSPRLAQLDQFLGIGAKLALLALLLGAVAAALGLIQLSGLPASGGAP
jgi:hypothetical protein